MTTVELLTRAADAAGRAADGLDVASDGDGNSLVASLSADHYAAWVVQMFAASGPDHWRAVEAMFRQAIERHGATEDACSGRARVACLWTSSLRPLAEQVLQHLGDTA